MTRDRILTTCYKCSAGDGEVKILDLNGNLQRQLRIRQDGSFMFILSKYITVSPVEEKIIVSDSSALKHTITCMTMDNHVIYQYTDDKMKLPEG